jgi:hypothetical protein
MLYRDRQGNNAPGPDPAPSEDGRIIAGASLGDLVGAGEDERSV